MAIQYTTGTINQPDAGSVGLSMIEKIRDDIVAHAAWELVEEFTAAGGTVRWYVFKCLAAQSGMPSDFYVIFCRRLSDGMLRMAMCESYSTGSHTMQYYMQYNYYNNVAFDNLGRNPATYVLGAADPSGSSGIPLFYYWQPSGTSTKWWIIVGDDFFTVAFNGANNGWFNAGVYTPLTVVPMLFPIQATGSQGTNGAYGTLTRNPTVANVTISGSAVAFVADTVLGFAADLRWNDALQGGQRPVGEIGMRIYENNTGERAVYGNALGKLKNVRTAGAGVPAGMAFGDAYVNNGTLWVPPSPADTRMWNTGVPSS